MNEPSPPSLAEAAEAERLLHELQVYRSELEQHKHELRIHEVEFQRQNEELRVVRAEVAAARDRYAELYELAPVGYFTLDHGGRIAAVNAAGEALLGLPARKVVGRRLAEFVLNDHLGHYTRFLARLVSDGKETCDLGLMRNDKSPMFVRLDGRMAKSAMEFFVAATDITEHWRNEVALASARDAAEQASRAKSSFLANMSHEMRTPLHIVVGIGHLLRRDLADSVQQQRLDQLCANSDHLLDLINNVLDLSRIEAGRLTLDRRAFRLGDVVERVLGVIATQARAKGLLMTVDIAPDLRDAMLEGDPLRLAQVLINLGGNAVKFTETGRLRLAIEQRPKDSEEAVLRFAVQDTGMGIGPEDQARLFEAFTQADTSPTRAHGGSGLGLAISQRLVGLMGGRIAVESQPGSGSTFMFELALARAAALPQEHPALAPVASVGGRRVLFAEDHPLSQEILFEMLEDLGCEVDVASDGIEAVECARSRDYHLILMDVQMPRLDGFAATRAIRALPRYADTPVIAVTASAFADDRRRCFDAGMNDHLGKPVTPTSLGAMLHRWLPSPPATDAASSPGEHGADPALSGISGLDPPAAMRSSPQRQADYRTLLRRFVVLHGQDMKHLSQCLADDKRSEAHKIAHDLKGIAGLIGARRIAALAHDIVLELRSGAMSPKIDTLVASCAESLAQLVAAAEKLPDEGGTTR